LKGKKRVHHRVTENTEEDEESREGKVRKPLFSLPLFCLPLCYL